jgi:hypothetical protein
MELEAYNKFCTEEKEIYKDREFNIHAFCDQLYDSCAWLCGGVVTNQLETKTPVSDFMAHHTN